MIKIMLYGSFQIQGPLQEDLTPRGNKACAIVALLSSAPRFRATRRWIESQLWSTRSAQQASASLRQALSELRKSLGAYQNILGSDRRDLWIDEDGFSISAPNEKSIYLQGLDVKDPEFDHWLMRKRSEYEASFLDIQSDIKAANIITTNAFHTQFQGEKSTDHIVELFQDQLCRNLHDNGVSSFMSVAGASLLMGDDQRLMFSMQSQVSTDKQIYTCKLLDSSSQKVLWNKYFRHDPTVSTELLEQDVIPQLACELSDEIVKAIYFPSNSATSAERHVDSLIGFAMNDMFSFESSRLLSADALFAAAYRARPMPNLLAWRCFVRMIQHVEQTDKNLSKLQLESDQLCAEALSFKDESGLVYALLSQVKGQLHYDNESAICLAQDALSCNSNSAMPNIAQAAVALRHNDSATALEHANRAVKIGVRSPMRHWWHMCQSLAYIGEQQFESAVLAAEAALLRAPGYRPPIRHLYALYIYLGNKPKAQAMLSQMQKLERGYSLDMLREDSDYPARTIRESPLIELRDLPTASEFE